MKNNTSIQPKVSSAYEIGAILEDQWGYDQTNVDFYCIIARSGDWVTIIPMKKKSTPDGSNAMMKEVMPLDIDWNEKSFRKKIRKGTPTYDHGKELGFPIRNYTGGGWCRAWDGKVSQSTHYA